MGYKFGILGFGFILLLNAGKVCAEDIPFLWDDEAPATEATQSAPDMNQPNIGRNEEPLTELTVTPPPAPPITINLPNTTPTVPDKPKDKPVVNKRVLGISLPSGSANTIEPSVGGIGVPSDVRGFDIDGFYLGMSPDEVVSLAREKGYKITKHKNAMSKFRTGYYESICKSRGIYIPADIRTCMNQMSHQNNTTYLSEITVNQPKKRESIQFFFSSPATNNQLWKMEYLNKGDNSLNFTTVNIAKKKARQEAFFNAVYDKYGYPDNADELVWGLPDDAYMKVSMYGSNYDASMTLVDTLLADEDYFEAEDWLDENKPFEHFGFED